ncbi:hypothetical protein XELAEV_18041643mg [Xenopus laevis]|uniref:Uncharacterized protein n=1 Tax=Xenopus laevis TaxID=8355 RepID=A0A974H5A5_XENLA|nr:hypothetical protein XELAEV_18041643mg [Xenopus laevis]
MLSTQLHHCWFTSRAGSLPPLTWSCAREGGGALGQGSEKKNKIREGRKDRKVPGSQCQSDTGSVSYTHPKYPICHCLCFFREPIPPYSQARSIPNIPLDSSQFSML